jgi:hypothetical protein
MSWAPRWGGEVCDDEDALCSSSGTPDTDGECTTSLDEAELEALFEEAKGTCETFDAGPSEHSMVKADDDMSSSCESSCDVAESKTKLDSLTPAKRRALEVCFVEAQRSAFEARVRRLDEELAAVAADLRAKTLEEHKCAGGDCVDCLAPALLQLHATDPVEFCRRVKSDADAEIWAKHVREQFDAEVAAALPPEWTAAPRPVATTAAPTDQTTDTTTTRRQSHSAPTNALVHNPIVEQTLSAIRAAFADRQASLLPFFVALEPQLLERCRYLRICARVYIDPQPPDMLPWLPVKLKRCAATVAKVYRAEPGDNHWRALQELVFQLLAPAKAQQVPAVFDNDTLDDLMQLCEDDCERCALMLWLQTWPDATAFVFNLAVREPDEPFFLMAITDLDTRCATFESLCSNTIARV